MVFRLQLVPTLITVPALILLIGLGTWQGQRLVWKTDLIERIDRQLGQAPDVLPARIADPAAWDYRRVRVDGVLAAETELAVASRTLTGRVGWHIVSPLIRADGTAVLINRGWVPDGREREIGPRAAPFEGPVTVTGVARMPAPPGWLALDNDPAGNTWYWTDLAAMARAAGLDPAGTAPILLYAAEIGLADGSPLLAGQPVPGQVRIDIPNNHLHYMLTWYGLAVALLGVYIAYHWRRPADR